jgi:hypothetical protein
VKATPKEEAAMKQYMISAIQPDGPPPEDLELDRIRHDTDAVNEEAKAAGAWVFGGGLTPASSATVVRAQDGEVLMTDGPYAEGKEHIGGFVIIAADDLDAALAWAGKFAGATTLPMEVRPFQDQS